MAPDKDLSFRLRFTAEDKAMLGAVATILRRSAADTVRFLIAEKHNQLLLTASKTLAGVKTAERIGGTQEAAESLLASLHGTVETLAAARRPATPKIKPRKKARKK